MTREGRINRSVTLYKSSYCTQAFRSQVTGCNSNCNMIRFLDLCPEIRNEIYGLLFPVGTTFITSQRLVKREDEKLLRYPKSAARHHPIASDPIDFELNLGLLGASRLIRQEACSVLQHNVKAKFELYIATDFRLIPKVILELVREAVVCRPIKDSRRTNYFLHFPNLKTAVVGLYVTDQIPFSSQYLDTASPQDRPACISEIRRNLNQYLLGGVHMYTCGRFRPVCTDAWSLTPRSWKWNTKTATVPVNIEAHIYLVKTSARRKNRPRLGVFAIYDFKHRKVTGIEERQFRRVSTQDCILPRKEDVDYGWASSWVAKEGDA